MEPKATPGLGLKGLFLPSEPAAIRTGCHQNPLPSELVAVPPDYRAANCPQAARLLNVLLTKTFIQTCRKINELLILPDLRHIINSTPTRSCR